MSIIEKAVNTLEKKGTQPEQAPRSSIVDEKTDTPVQTAQRVESAVEVAEHAVDVSSDVANTVGAGVEESFAVAENMHPGSHLQQVNIPFKTLRSKGMLIPSTPRSAIAEEYRTIKRPLLKNIAGDQSTPAIPRGNLIMVTSALEGDGKTFSSICLALSIAMEKDKKVLFVDADTAKAEAGRTLGVPPDSPGLIDVLENQGARANDFILPTNVDKFRILPAGGVHTHANELLASERMRQLMIELADEYPDRVIVFDSPPLLLTTEAAVLASFMGQLVFVVSADATPQSAVTQAIESIGQEKMVGLLLNRSRKRNNPYHYTYGAGPYGYGSRDRGPVPESGN